MGSDYNWQQSHFVGQFYSLHRSSMSRYFVRDFENKGILFNIAHRPLRLQETKQTKGKLGHAP
jgi:hypothetical protein